MTVEAAGECGATLKAGRVTDYVIEDERAVERQLEGRVFGGLRVDTADFPAVRVIEQKDASRDSEGQFPATPFRHSGHISTPSLKRGPAHSTTYQQPVRFRPP